MSKMTKQQKNEIKGMFGARYTDDHVERMLYGHDIGAMPGLVKPLIGNTVPDCVVQPESIEELSALAKWANERAVALTPRGKASSGYGGVLPMQRGIVVDFYRMRSMVSIDREAMTATTQAGMVWEKAEAALNKAGLQLKLYPSSLPSSTVAGWLAQGGTGFGSYRSGWFADNVVSAKVVMPDGSVRDFAGDELKLISDACGCTGLIAEVTFRVEPKAEMKIMAISFDDVESLSTAIAGMAETQLPIWSLTFTNPKMAELKNKAPVQKHWGHEVGRHVPLPDSFIVIIACREEDERAVRSGLENIIAATGGSFLSDEVAEHEWDYRFDIMTVKRLGPSLVPTEVVVPLKGLASFYEEVGRTVVQPVVKESVVIKDGPGGEPEVVILGFIPADQRTIGFNFVFALALTIIKAAEKVGGRAYSTGLYFTGKADSILGPERVERMRRFKAENDKNGIMNPGKVVEKTAISRALDAAAAVEPLARPFGNAVATKVAERPHGPVRGIPADVAWFAYACSQCGYCVDECDQYYSRGWESQSPRGKWYWLREFMEGREEWDQKMVDTILVCTTCELCNTRCSAALPIEESWMKLRGELIEKEGRMTFPPFSMMSEALQAEGDIWAGYRKNRTDWFPEDLKEKHLGVQSKNCYFAGCTAAYVENDIAQATVRLLDEAGVDFSCAGNDESCCGTPMLVSGKWTVFAETMKKNIEAVRKTGADTIIASCPACDMMWRQVYPTWAKRYGIDYDFTVRHYSEIMAEKLKSGEFKFPDNPDAPKVKVTWHDSCHAGRASGIYDPPRDMIKAVPGVELVEMEHNREAAHCCGSVLTLIKEPPVAAEIGKVRLDEAVEAGAEKLLALCPCCEVQLRVSRDKKEVPIQIQDLAHFCAATLGYEFPDPEPEVTAQWGVFDQFITLMTPQGFADVMGEMWPELIDAMPFGMGPMMRGMGKVPGALDAMKPLFPVLFPRLLPMMMPKVLPRMLEVIEEKIAMPDYMLEQMPALLPKVMDELMPHMIGDVVPLVTGPMVAYLKGKA